MAAETPTLDAEQVATLTELFSALDKDGNGTLDIEEFKRLGKAMMGRVPTTEETLAQLNRADKDRNAVLDLDEWLAFSQGLAMMPRDDFFQRMNDYIAAVKSM